MGAHKKIDVIKVGALNLHYNKKSFGGFSLGIVSNKVTKLTRTVIFLEVTKITIFMSILKKFDAMSTPFLVLIFDTLNFLM